jgi:hypothetical protein
LLTLPPEPENPLLDYLPAAQAIHGIAFAYWQPPASKVAATV